MKKKHVYVYSPSGAIRDKAAFKRGVRRLELLGCEVEVDPAALSSFMRFAGDDDTRLSAIERAAASRADVAMISRGGYGLTRLLGRIPYKSIQKAVERGTDFIGFSDFTAFQLAAFAKSGICTWAGPALCEGFGVPIDAADPSTGPNEIMEACFSDFLAHEGEGAGWKIARDSEDSLKLMSGLHVKNAVLWGGNLSVLTSLIGTPYFPIVRKGVLFLEDVGETPYRVERMLSQLLHAGILKDQKAIILGQFTDIKGSDHDKGFRFKSVIAWLQSQLKVPVLNNLPFGHVPTKVLLPFGTNVELFVEGRDALLVWGHR